MFLKKIFIDTLGIFLVICFFALTFKEFFAIESPYLITTTTDFGQKITYYDFGQYFIQVKNSFNNFGQELNLDMPDKQWRSVAFLTLFEDLANNLAFMFNWFVFVINVLIWPIRLLAWIIKSTLVILGFIAYPNTTINNQTYNPQWFMTVLQQISQNLEIPYIQ